MTVPSVRLGDVAVIERVALAPSEIPDAVLFVGLENMESTGGFDNVVPVPKDSIKSTKFKFDDRHVLYGKLRPYLRKIGRPSFSGVCSTDILPILPGDRIHKDYLFHYLRTPAVVALATTRSTGANLPRLSPKTLEDFTVPLPSLREQRLIADILDKAELLRQKRQESLKWLLALEQSIFLEMFDNPVSNLKGWRRIPFSDLLSSIDSGWSPVCLDHPAAPSEWGVLKLGAITTNRYLEFENKALPPGVDPRIALEVQPGDLLFSRKNTKELVGACVLVGSTRERLLLPDLIFRFRFKHDAPCTPEYIWALMTNASKRAQVQLMATGTSGSMPNISKEKLKRLEIELPPLQMQEQFSSYLQKIRLLESKINLSLSRTQALLQSLENELFSSGSSLTSHVLANV